MLTHPHKVNSPRSELLSSEQPRLSYDSDLKGQGPDVGGQHPPLVRGELRFYRKLIIEIASSSSLLQKEGK